MRSDSAASRVDKLIAVDLDGTLVSAGNSVGPENLAAIRRATEQGAAVAVVTGRPYASAEALARRVGLPEIPLVAFNGALIRRPRRGEVLLQRSVPAEFAAEVVEECVRRQLHLHYYVDDQLYVTADNDKAKMYCQRIGMTCQAVGDMRDFAGREPFKLLIIDEPSTIISLLDEFQYRWRGQLYVTRSQAEYLEFLSPDASKGQALDWLLDFYGVERARTMAIGDALNDIPLLERAAYAAAMPGSDPELLTIAQFTPPEVRNGVASAIDWFLNEVD
jgi:Cof subfamily protein (haloacid dehalogenase superfamily)